MPDLFGLFDPAHFAPFLAAVARLDGRTARIGMAAGFALIVVWVAWRTRG